MATYYVRKTGSDAAAGTSAGAAWLTIGKALGAAGMASGDVCYVGAGVYRETITAALTNPTVETKIIGDVDGSKTGDSGEVRLSNFTSGDNAASNASAPLTFTKDFLTFRNIVFHTGTVNAVITGTGSHDITFTDCAFASTGSTSPPVVITTTPNVASNILIDRCQFVAWCQNGAIVINLARPTGADFDYNIVIQNCVIQWLGGGNACIDVGATGANSFNGGGVKIYNCTISGGANLIRTSSANLSTTIPAIKVRNCVLISGNGQSMSANAANQIDEDYNLCMRPNTDANVTSGAHSIRAKWAPTLHFGQERVWGARLRPYGMPTAGSPILGFGVDTGVAPTVDMLNAPRPAGGASAVIGIGAYERGNTFGKETGTVRTGSNAISITGPGYQDFTLRVNAVSTTVTAYVRWDATYAGTKPRMQVLGGTECGVADATATAVGSSGSWELLTLTFTPTAKGIVKVRFLSSDTNGGGKMFVDDLLAA